MDIQQEMGKKLVEAMDPETTRAVLFKVIEGKDVYDAILDAGDDKTELEPPVKKKRRTRRRKALGDGLLIPPDPSLRQPSIG
jgi:hypothetical protein